MGIPAELLEAKPKIPAAGLVEVTRGWSGRGQLFEALAAVDEPERQWSARDVERRVHRILFQTLLPHLTAWPVREHDWLEALPAQSLRPREITLAPTSGTSWVETRIRGGWPPREFFGRRRVRIADTLLVTALRWTLEALEPVVRDARMVLPGVDAGLEAQLDAALALLDEEILALAPAIAPGPSDIAAIQTEGYPWNELAPVASLLATADQGSLLELAAMLVVPDDPLTGRLFHLGVLGELLLALRATGAMVTPIRPLSGAASVGPSYRVLDQHGVNWRLWFEAAGLWSTVPQAAPYSIASAGVPGSGSSIGGDLMLITDAGRVLIVECKYSRDPSRVARDGYHQASAYAVEARQLVSDVVSVVMGPEDVVSASNLTTTVAGRLGICRPDEFAHLLAEIGIA